jgi:hypothetical protein
MLYAISFDETTIPMLVEEGLLEPAIADEDFKYYINRCLEAYFVLDETDRKRCSSTIRKDDFALLYEFDRFESPKYLMPISHR